jgi:hypothetical protein
MLNPSPRDHSAGIGICEHGLWNAGKRGRRRKRGRRYIIRAHRRVCSQAQCATHRDRTTARVNSTMDKTGQGGAKHLVFGPEVGCPRIYAYTIKRPPCVVNVSKLQQPAEKKRNVECHSTKCQERVLRNITGLERTSCTSSFSQRLCGVQIYQGSQARR